MGWFWGKSDAKANGTTGDAYQNLDDGLRDFLDKQTPKEHGDQQKPSPLPKDSESSYSARAGLSSPQADQTPSSDEPSVPNESLFPDGRYAHLWKTYRPEGDVSGSNDQDKLVGVLETIKDRKAAIGRAALENCVEEQMIERECFHSGSLADRMTMCRKQNRAFNRCFSMQSRFLRALGYLSSQHTTPADEEKIQMHADRLYHEMLERERTMEEAKTTGQETLSATQPLVVIPTDSTTQALGEESAWARARRKAQLDGSPSHLGDFPPEKQAEIKNRLLRLTPAEREVELQLMAAESRAIREYTDQIDAELRAQKAERDERRGAGKETVGDSLKRMWGYGSR